MQYLLKRTHWPTVILIAILIWAGVLRLFDLGIQSMWMDESYSALAAIKTAIHGSPIMDSGMIYGRAYPHTYLLALVAKIFGSTEFSFRLPSVIFGLLSIWITYLFSARIFKSKAVGLVSATFIAFGYFDIAWSRQIRMYSEMQFFYLLSIYLFYRFLSSKKLSWKWLIGAGASGLITIATHKMGLFILPTLLVMWAFFHHDARKNKILIITGAIFLILGIWISGGFEFVKWYWLKLIKLSFWLQEYLAFLFKNHFFTLLLAIAGFVFAVKKKINGAIAVGVTFALILFFIGINPQIGMRYIFPFMPLLYILAGYSVVELWKKKVILKSIIGIVIVIDIAIGSHVLIPRTNYFLEFDPINRSYVIDYTPQPDFKSVYEQIKEDVNPEDIFIVAHTAIHDLYMPNTEYYRINFIFDTKTAEDYSIIEKDGQMFDFYTGAPVIFSVEDLQILSEENHGYIIFDYFAADSHIRLDIIDYIKKNTNLIIDSQMIEDLPWTRLWVYRF